mmetsp:Transcript_26367/g.49912  ORF Transcript_26367/g.49912 Transcript_26367/m.49912 type:complete len:227 (-) Transcript_26367:1068-1748(-)
MTGSTDFFVETTSAPASVSSLTSAPADSGASAKTRSSPISNSFSSLSSFSSFSFFSFFSLSFFSSAFCLASASSSIFSFAASRTSSLTLITFMSLLDSSGVATSSRTSLTTSSSIPLMTSCSPSTCFSASLVEGKEDISSFRKNVRLIIRRLMGTFELTERSNHCCNESCSELLEIPVDRIPRSWHASLSSILVRLPMPSHRIRWSSSLSARILNLSWNLKKASLP